MTSKLGKMELTARLGRRFRVEFISGIITTISGALLTILLARLLDPTAYGTLFLSISIFSVLRVFSKLGLANSAARYIADYREQDPSQIPHIIERSLIFVLIAIFSVSVILLIGSENISYWLDEPGLVPLLQLGVLFIAFQTLSNFSRIIAQGAGNITLAAGIKATERMSRLIFAILFVYLGYNAIGALGGFVIGSVLSTCLGMIVIYNDYFKYKPTADSIEPGLTQKILRYNIPLTITSISGKLDNQIDTILIGLFLNPLAVSYYVVSKQIINFTEMPASALGFSISPSFGKLKSGHEIDTAARMFESALNHVLLLYIPAAVGIFFISEQAIELIFGSEYSGAAPVLQVLSVYTILRAITACTDQPLDYLGRARIRAVAKSIAAVSNVLLNIILIPWIGVVGAALATVITHSFYVFIKIVVVIDELPLNYKSILIYFGRVGIITAGMSIILWYTTNYISNLLSLIAVVALSIIVWGVLSVVFGAIDSKVIKGVIK